MNIGVLASPAMGTVDIAFTARVAEELGFESIWCAEHPVIPVHYTTPYPGAPDGIVPSNYHRIVLEKPFAYGFERFTPGIVIEPPRKTRVQLSNHLIEIRHAEIIYLTC